MLAALDITADERLTSLALRIVLSDHIGILHESQVDLLTEAEHVFAPKKTDSVKPKAKADSKEKAAIGKVSSTRRKAA